MSRVLKQTKTKTGSTSSSTWTWKQVVKEYFENDSTSSDYYITTNKSIIVVESYLGRPSGQSTQSFGGTGTTKITCDGESKSKSKTWNYGDNYIAGGGWFLIQSEEFEVEHEADGTKEITVSSSLSTSDFNPNSASASSDITLTVIPRATACPNFDGYIESSAPISLNPASTSFKHRLYYSYNGKTGYYPSSTGFFANTGSLSLGTSFYSYTPKSSGTGTITLYTYDSSGNLIGSKTGTITVRCDRDKCSPTIEATIIDINSITANLTSGTDTSNILIKGYSNAQITYTIETLNEATLLSKKVNSKTLGSSPYTISNVTTGTFEIIAIDSRKFDTTLTKTNTLINYIPLTLDFTAYRPTPTGSEIKIKFQGNYFNKTFGAVENTLELSWKYRIKGTSTWTDGGTFVKDTDYTISNNKFTSVDGDISLSNSLFDYQKNYEIAVFYADKLINTSTKKTVPKGKPVLNWEDELVNVNGEFTINDVNILDVIYPVGSTYVSEDNTDPKGKFGGTWELTNKEFSAWMTTFASEDVGDYFTPTDNVSSVSLGLNRNGTELHLRLFVTLSTTLDDTNLELGTFNLENLGISRFSLSRYGMVAGSDSGDCFIVYQVSYLGVVTILDIITKDGSNALATGKTFYLDITNTMFYGYILNNACNKFYWKRTA